MKKVILCFLLLGLVACSSEEEAKSVPTDNVASDNGVGPFNLKLSSNTKLENNSFSIKIDQEEGKVEFLLPPTDQTTWMKFRFSQTTVTGCDESQVEIIQAWKTEETSNGQLIQNGDYFSSTPEEKGTFVVAFKKIGGCSSISFNMVVDHITDPLEVPKHWSFNVDSDLKGIWSSRSSDADLVLEVAESYINFEGSTDRYCFRGFGYPATDESQYPHYVGASNGSNALCQYILDEENGKDVLYLNCQHISGWDCGEIKDVKFYRD